MLSRKIKTVFMLCLLGAGAAHGQADYPNRPISLVASVPPGGVIDTVARVIGPGISERVGEQVIVVNKPGAGGNIAAAMVARSAPDGYTFLVGYSMFHVGNPAMYSSINWDPITDFSSVSMLAVAPHVVAVHPSLPVKNMRELVDYIKSNPGKLNYASSGNGSVPHVGMELLKQKLGLDITHIPYKGAGPAVQDTVSGSAQLVIMTPPSLLGFIQQGRLRAIAVAAKQRLPQLPDVPTTEEAGFPGFELEAWVALFSPAGTPAPVVNKVAEAAKSALETAQVKQSFETAGVEPRYMPPGELDEVVKHDLKYWGEVIKSAGIRVD